MRSCFARAAIVPITALGLSNDLGSSGRASTWGRMAQAVGRQLVSTEWQQKQLAWSQFLDDAMEGHASVGHKLSKVPVPWHQGELLHTDGATTTSPIALLDNQRAIWAQQWDAHEEPHEEPPPLANTALALLPRLTLARVRSAALSFKKQTATPDALHPRHIGYMSDDALQAIILLFALIESVGNFPGALCGIMIAISRKKLGGVRPIALYRALYRAWCKARAYLLREWEAQHGGADAFNTSQRVATTDGVWRQAFLAEEAEAACMPVAALLLDTRKCYEYISHVLLAAEGQATSYP